MLGKKAALDLGVFRIFGRKGLTNLPILKSNFRSFFLDVFPASLSIAVVHTPPKQCRLTWKFV